MFDIFINFYITCLVAVLVLFGVIAYNLHSLVSLMRFPILSVVGVCAIIPFINTIVSIGFLFFVFYMTIAFNNPLVSTAITLIENFKGTKS